MAFMGIRTEDLCDIIAEHRRMEPLRDTPAYKELLARARLQELQRHIGTLQKEEAELRDAIYKLVDEQTGASA